MTSLLQPWFSWDAPPPLFLFVQNPLLCTARSFHHLLSRLRSRPATQNPPIRVICISDTHTFKKRIPEGDVLIHAGDLSQAGSVDEIQAQIDWLNSLPHTHKVVIAGNADTYLDARARRTLSSAAQSGTLQWRSLHYLQHSGIILSFPDRSDRTLRVYGAPQIPKCGGPDNAFQYERDQDAWRDTVPTDTDILVTHTPPQWHLDSPLGLGCRWLLREIWRVRPLLHVFGHVHAGRGIETVQWDDAQAAYERICARPGGLIKTLLDPRNWVDLARIIAGGVSGIIWSVVWGGNESCSILVNAALMRQSTGKLDNEPRVIDL